VIRLFLRIRVLLGRRMLPRCHTCRMILGFRGDVKQGFFFWNMNDGL